MAKEKKQPFDFTQPEEAMDAATLQAFYAARRAALLSGDDEVYKALTLPNGKTKDNPSATQSEETTNAGTTEPTAPASN